MGLSPGSVINSAALGSLSILLGLFLQSKSGAESQGREYNLPVAQGSLPSEKKSGFGFSECQVRALALVANWLLAPSEALPLLVHATKTVNCHMLGAMWMSEIKQCEEETESLSHEA